MAAPSPAIRNENLSDTDEMDEDDEYDSDATIMSAEDVIFANEVSHDYHLRREVKRKRLETIDLDHDISISERDKTSIQQSSNMGDRRTIPRAVQKRRADRQTDRKKRNKIFRRTERPNDRTPVTGVEDSESEGSAGTLDILDSQDHHISIAESESGEETISQESSTSKDRRTRARTVQKRRTHRQTNINTSRSKTRSHIDRPTVRGTPDSSWSNTPFSPTLFSFDEDVGLSDSFSVSEDSSELDFFLEFFTHDLIDRTVMETNNYHNFLMTTQTFPQYSRVHKWRPTDRKEMYMFLCVVMSMAHVKKHNMKDYWTKSIPTATPAFSDMMTQDRFFSLLRHLRFSDSREHVPGNKLQKVKWVVDYLRNKFTSYLKPYQDLCIDESVLVWKGKLPFRQYLPQKRNRFGLKLFVLCDVETGCILDFIVYTGTGTDIEIDKELGYSGSVLKKLLAPHLDKGHNIYVDSWYTSPKLFKYLQSRKTGACGTVRSDMKLMPVLPNVKCGEQVSYHKDDMLCVKWCDKSVVHMLTTLHSNTLVDTDKKDCTTGASIKKPACVVEYTQKIRLVDKADMLISSVQCVRKTLKWYKKLFFHLLDMCILNSYYMYLVKTGKKPSLLDFSLSVSRQMIERFGRPTHTVRPGRTSTALTNPIRLSARHFPSAIPSTPRNPRPRRNCHVCSHTNRREKRRKNTHWMCEDCGVSLCLPQCFKEYHTIIHI